MQQYRSFGTVKNSFCGPRVQPNIFLTTTKKLCVFGVFFVVFEYFCRTVDDVKIQFWLYVLHIQVILNL